MSDKTEPGVTFSIPEIMDTIERKYDNTHGLIFDCYGMAFIIDETATPEIEFNDRNELHLWVGKTRIELDEKEVEQSAINDRINAKSANVDIMDQRW